jgi:integrase
VIQPRKHVANDGTVTWKVQFRHGRNKADTGPGTTSETFATRREATEFAKWLHALGSQGALDRLYEAEQQAAVPSLDAIAADHIALLTGIESGTRTTYTRMWQRIWAPRLGHLPANRITADDIKRAVNELGDTYSHKSLQNQRGLLSGVLGRAVDLGHLPKNPANGVRLPRGQEADRTDMRIITPAEFAEVIEKIPEHYRGCVRFLYGTGCRWGEMVALQVQDVALPNIRIRRALKWSPDGPRLVGATKTKRSNRTVAVGHVLADDLTTACAGKAGTDLVFTAPRGGQLLHRTFWSRVWLPAVSHLTPRPRIHDLRHSHASILLGAGQPPHVVQARLGHESIKTTVDVYGSLMPDAQIAAAAAADLAFGVRPRELD